MLMATARPPWGVSVQGGTPYAAVCLRRSHERRVGDFDQRPRDIIEQTSRVRLLLIRPLWPQLKEIQIVVFLELFG